MKKTIVLATMIVSLLVAAAILPLMGCTKTEAPAAVKPDKIVLHCIGDLSGVYSKITDPLVQANKHAIEWYNREKGGVQGVPMEIVYWNTESKADLTLAHYAAIVESTPRPAMIITLDTQDAEPLHDRFIEDKVVNYTVGASREAIYPVGYTVGVFCGYPAEFGAFIDWVAGEWANKSGVKPVVAMLSWEGVFGKAALTPETRKYAEQKGVEIVAEEYFPPMYQNLDAHITRIKDTGANWIYSQSIIFGLAAIGKGMKAQGLLPNDPYDPNSIHLATMTIALDESSLAYAGEAGENLTGLVGSRSIATFAEKDNAGIQLLSSVMEAKGTDPDAKVGAYVSGWAMILTIGEALNRAVEADGWATLEDGSGLLREMLRTKDYKPLDLTEYSMTPERPVPNKTRIMYVKEGGEILPLTPGYITCPDVNPMQ